MVGKIEVDNIEKKSKGKKEEKAQPPKKKPVKEEEPVAKAEPVVIPEPEIIPPVEEKAPETAIPAEDDRYIKTEFVVLSGPKQVGKIDVTQFEKKPASKETTSPDKSRPNRIDKKHRPRIQKKESVAPATHDIKGPDKNKSKIQKPKRNEPRPAPSEEDIDGIQPLSY